MKFVHFQKILADAIERVGAVTTPAASSSPDKLAPLVLAYIGDAWFSLFVRTRLLAYEQKQVRVLHTLDSAVICATMQAIAVRELEPMLEPLELEIIRRGRNAKSRTPKSASVQDYHSSTGFESLLGYLFLKGDQDRLDKLSEDAFAIIAREMQAAKKRGGKK